MTSDEKKAIFDRLSKAILEYNSDESLTIVKEALAKGINPLEVIEQGLVVGIKKVGELFEKQEYVLPQIMLAADAMTLSMEFLKNKIPKNNLPEPIGKIVIGTVAGDMHDIGCKIVSSLFRVSGFEVHFIGRDVPADRFIDTAEKKEADIIGASSLLTTTMAEQKFLIKKIEKRGLVNKYLVMIGGGPITEEWSKEIGANGYAPDAVSAVAKAKELMKLE